MIILIIRVEIHINNFEDENILQIRVLNNFLENLIIFKIGNRVFINFNVVITYFDSHSIIILL